MIFRIDFCGLQPTEDSVCWMNFFSPLGLSIPNFQKLQEPNIREEKMLSLLGAVAKSDCSVELTLFWEVTNSES